MHNNKQKNFLAFSLLEVMIALMLLSLSLTSLLLVQSRTTKMAIEARNVSIATQFARLQLAECKKKAIEKITAVSDFQMQGDFESLGYKNFTWECHAPKLSIKPPSESKLDNLAKNSVDKKDVKNTKMDTGSASAVISLVTNALNDALRELTVIVRFKDGNHEDEVRVVTHVVDLGVASGLARMISSQSGMPNQSKNNNPNDPKNNKER